MQFWPLATYFISDLSLKLVVTLTLELKKTVFDVKNPIFHSSDKSQSDFSRLTSEKIALTSEKNASRSEKCASTSEKHELHKIWDATLTQLGFQCASDVSSAAL